MQPKQTIRPRELKLCQNIVVLFATQIQGLTPIGLKGALQQPKMLIYPKPLVLRPVHTGTNIGARYSPVFFNAFFVHTQAIFADDEPSEHGNSFPDIRWRLM